MATGNLNPNPIEKSSGLIRGLSPFRLFPCLWIGLPPYHNPSANSRKKLIKEGQFFIVHPYGGSSCPMVDLHGIFLPLTTCRDKRLTQKLTQLQEKYYEHPFKSAKPNLDEVLRIRTDLLEIGPLDITHSFRAVEEAFFPVNVTQILYAWLRKNFEMVTLLSDDGLYEPLKIMNTRALKWELIEDFTKWFFSFDFQSTESTISSMLTCAFIYPNSDGCDNFGVESLTYPDGIQ